jgi:MerR family transcriptional regulator/heat shock protein HspR
MTASSDLWDEPCYAIGVVAEMVELHPQTLRRYEELGLLVPARKAGRRLYSPRDVELLRYISRLSTELGLNLAGIEVILRLNRRINELEAEIERLQRVRAELEAQITALEAQLARM